MRPEKHGDTIASRRKFLKQMGCAPVLFLPSPLKTPGLFAFAPGIPHFAQVPLSEVHPESHYPVRSRLDDIVRLATPGTDEYAMEGYVAAIKSTISGWGNKLKEAPPAITALSELLDISIQASALSSAHDVALRTGEAIQTIRRQFEGSLLAGRERFLQDVISYFSTLTRVEVADFEIYSCTPVADSPLALDTSIRYEIVGTAKENSREQRIGSWKIRWLRDDLSHWTAKQWTATEETVSRSMGPIFLDVTSHALGRTTSYQEQLLHGVDYWRTVLDGAIGVDVYGNNGLAVGDFDNDELDDLYVCQPAGLPNRLYHNRGDGTFEDVTEKSGVGVLDFTACALFADFQNHGLQDLLVVCATGPLLYVNDGKGRFSLKRDAFQFARAPQGAFTHAAAADYDHDGRLDVYFCLYNYYQGLDQYRYPVPYFDARNGPPNYLFHNEGNGSFMDRTAAAGLNVENDRYSFACCWGDSNGNRWPDLYVVNDFGRNNLYRNNGDGSFAAVSKQAKVDEVGAGMSACWADFDNDGKQDIYAAGMWVAAGMRVFEDPHFHSGESENVRALYRRHMTGNSMYRNRGNGSFENVGKKAGVEMGRWSWSTDAWDFDHDGYPDLYVANGYLSGLDDLDVSSFFWRQVVAKSPADSTPSPAYELGWGAINELIRSDATWNGHERNVFFRNNRDGTFSDVSGVVGLDFRDDSRAFVLSDFDGDGRLEVVLKNRNAPQIRILRLAMDAVGNSISFRLQGDKSNRDAIGAAVTVEAGTLRQTKFIQAGSGFLSQHTKELFFGVGKDSASIDTTIRWPSGLTQTFHSLPLNCRIHIREGSADFQARPYVASPPAWKNQGNPSKPDVPLSDVQTWLIDPVKAPDFSLPDVAGNLRHLRDFEGRRILLNFWASEAPACLDQLQILGEVQSRLASELSVLAVNLDIPSDTRKLKSLAQVREQTYPILLADSDTAGIYNIVYRYMFSRHRNLPLPISFLIDASRRIVRVYQGQVTVQQLSADLKDIPEAADRVRRALPFTGNLVQDVFQRNAFTYGVAFFQNGFLDEAAQAFQQAIADKPDDPEALYNLGTVYLRRDSLIEAEQYLEQAVNLRPNYPEAWNNLGMIAAQKGDDPKAITNFEKSLELRPAYATALLNLANVYKRQGNLSEAEKLLNRALVDEPRNPEVNYGLGMIYARRDEREKAILFLQKAISLRPGYADALNNLGVLFVQTRQYQEAKHNFDECIRLAPEFDQAYLNLARLDLMQNQKDDARAVLQALLQKQPQHKMAQQMLEMLY